MDVCGGVELMEGERGRMDGTGKGEEGWKGLNGWKGGE